MFIEAMLIELPPQAGDLSALSFEQIRARADRSILTAPQFMARDQVTAVFMIDVMRLSITPTSLPDDDVLLDIKLTGDAETTTSQRFHDGQMILIPATPVARPNTKALLVLRPHIVRET